MAKLEVHQFGAPPVTSFEFWNPGYCFLSGCFHFCMHVKGWNPKFLIVLLLFCFFHLGLHNLENKIIVRLTHCTMKGGSKALPFVSFKELLKKYK